MSKIMVDLNCDMGESFGRYKLEVGENVLKNISSANIACGFHASDPMVMDRTVKQCKEYDVQVGAHPGLPDLLGFGRRRMDISPEEAKNYILYQLGALSAFCESLGVKLQHVKPHGALYNMAANEKDLAKGMVQGLASLSPSPNLLVLSGSKFGDIGRKAGLKVVNEAFADRAYNEDGTLVSRKLEGAVLHNPDKIAQRAARMVSENKVETFDGKEIDLKVDSLCVHGDTPEAIEIVEAIVERFEKEGIEVVSQDQL